VLIKVLGDNVEDSSAWLFFEFKLMCLVFLCCSVAASPLRRVPQILVGSARFVARVGATPTFRGLLPFLIRVAIAACKASLWSGLWRRRFRDGLSARWVAVRASAPCLPGKDGCSRLHFRGLMSPYWVQIRSSIDARDPLTFSWPASLIAWQLQMMTQLRIQLLVFPKSLALTMRLRLR